MNPNGAQGAGATAEAEGTAATTTQPTPPNPRREVAAPPSGKLLEAVLKDMAGGDLPADVIEDINKRRSPAPAGPPPNLADLRRQQIAELTGADAEGDPTEQELEEEQPEGEIQTPGDNEEEEQEEPEGQPQGAAGAEEETELEIPEPSADWPEDARAQVLDARKKLRKRTEELNQVAEKAQELLRRAQIAEAAPPRASVPTFQEPLPDVMNFEQLKATHATWKRAKRWAEDHEEGAEKGVDKGPDGEELTRDYTPEQIRALKRTAEDILEEAIPQRAAYLEKAPIYAQEAARQYPEIFQDTPESAQAAAILAQVPEIKRAPDFLLWLGAAITGRKIKTGGNGAGGPGKPGPNGKALSRAAETILNAPKLRPSPVASKARAVAEPGATRGGGNGAGAATTKQEARQDLLKTQLSDRDLEAYIARRLGGRAGKGGRERVLA